MSEELTELQIVQMSSAEISYLASRVLKGYSYGIERPFFNLHISRNCCSLKYVSDLTS